MKRQALALGLIVGALLLIPTASAAPEIRDISLATAFVDGSTDYFEFAGGGNLQTGVQITITAPDGSNAAVVRGASSDTTTPVSFYLDGTHRSGGTQWTWTGNLDGAPADGTWSIHAPSSQYNSMDTSGTFSAPGPTLIVQSKGIHFGIFQLSPNTRQQYWNWHQTTGTWNEPSTVPGCTAVTCTNDVIDEGPEEDPNFSRFFSAAGGNDYTAYTLDFAVNCAAEPTQDTMSITGAWLGASGTAFSSHIFRDGDFTGVPDLRVVAGATTTTEENEGATPSGTDTETGIPYNNAAGTSYQFRIRTAAQGEELGVVVFAPAAQCAEDQFDTASDTELDPAALDASASQAQCDGDATTLEATMQDTPSGLSEHLLHLYVFDANAGAVGTPDPIEVYHKTTPNLHRTAPGTEAHSHYIAEVFPPGNYLLYAYADYTGIGAVDYVASEAFSVPVGSCIDTEGDDSPLFQQIVEHRQGSLEVMNMSFGTIGFDGFLLLLFWLAGWLWAAYNRYWFILATTTGGLLDTIIPALPLGFVEWIVFSFFALTLQYWSEQRLRRNETPKRTVQT